RRASSRLRMSPVRVSSPGSAVSGSRSMRRRVEATPLSPFRSTWPMLPAAPVIRRRSTASYDSRGGQVGDVRAQIRHPFRMPGRRWPRIEPMGDAALFVELGQRVDTALNTRALALSSALRARRGVREVVPGYASVVVHYDPEQVSPNTLAGSIQRLVVAKPPPAA